MSRNIFTGKTIEECLALASSKLNIHKDELEYKIIEEKRGIFIKRVTISVKVTKEIEEGKSKDHSVLKAKGEGNKDMETSYKNNINLLDGTVRVQDGKILVTNNKEDGKPATVRGNNKVKVLVNGNEITSKQEVYENSKIEVIFDENIAERMMNINVSHDAMEAYVTVNYIPENIYKLKNMSERNNLEFQIELKEQKYPNPYTIDEIKKILLQNGIKVGVVEKNLDKLTELRQVGQILVAVGQKCVKSTDDKIEIKFDVDYGKKLKEDANGNIDYKSIGRVHEVKKGETLAVRQIGLEGKDGISVKGNIIRHTKRKKVNIKLGQGCEFKDENTVISSIEGKPIFKSGTIAVHPIHNVEKDVDITTGNIDFGGDVVIHGSVKEGMRVDCGQNLIVNQNVEHAKLYSKRDMTILGNVINSDLHAGGEDIVKRNKLKVLKKLNSGLLELISTVDHIKKFNLLGKKVREGEIVKVLIENKFKYITTLCKEFGELSLQGEIDEEKLINIDINQKLMGVGPLNIKDINEINLILVKIKRAISAIEITLAIPVTMNINYCQDSVLKCSGNVMVTGKGEYVSEIICHGSVQFVTSGSLARGGLIKAKDEIRCKEVGSEGGVSTKLVVDGEGHIWVDIAYQNTRFIVGGKEYILEVPSKDIHAYLADDGELVVEKFVL